MVGTRSVFECPCQPGGDRTRCGGTRRSPCDEFRPTEGPGISGLSTSSFSRSYYSMRPRQTESFDYSARRRFTWVLSGSWVQALTSLRLPNSKYSPRLADPADGLLVKGKAEKAIHRFWVSIRIAPAFKWLSHLYWVYHPLARLLSEEGMFDDTRVHID